MLHLKKGRRERHHNNLFFLIVCVLPFLFSIACGELKDLLPLDDGGPADLC